MSANPFHITQYKGPEYFCDREEETKNVIEAIKNGRSITIHSIRRLGKTGLIKHVFHKLQQSRKYIPVYIDIYDVISIEEFVDVLCSKIIFALEKSETKFLKQITVFFGKYRPSFSFDHLTGNPVVSLDIHGDKEIKYTLDILFSMISKSKKTIVLAIDEFQQVNSFRRKTIPATLRKYIQEVNNLICIFSGSQNHLLLDMMNSPKQALFRSTQLFPLHKIDRKLYKEFIRFHFKQGNKSIPLDVIEDGLSWTRTHTFYTQYVFNRLYGLGLKKITETDLSHVKYSILKENEAAFINYKNLLTIQQWKLLHAIGREDGIDSPTSKDFIHKYALGAHSTVRKSLQFLVEKELAYAENQSDLNQKPAYVVYDVFLSRWLANYGARA